ncbi:hypothetical protein KIPB_013384 [Kipferlia bialata]|uniref:Uncharacterized protein n=1 Tax=Kipferlia bialata TaxID=797122 RepID=A0A391NS23_9EUKA|nr:hypothetical protein KIPB_013384 [Kipferlia bialata]|eukprot:g13384.t1
MDGMDDTFGICGGMTDELAALLEDDVTLRLEGGIAGIGEADFGDLKMNEMDDAPVPDPPTIEEQLSMSVEKCNQLEDRLAEEQEENRALSAQAKAEAADNRKLTEKLAQKEHQLHQTRAKLAQATQQQEQLGAKLDAAKEQGRALQDQVWTHQ